MAKFKSTVGFMPFFHITWENTGEEVDRVDAYDWTEYAEGIDQHGNKWLGFAIMSLGEIETIEEPEMI